MASNEPNDTRARFKRRLCQWALEDARREIKDGFPFLRKIKSSAVNNILEWMQDLSLEEKTRVFAALVRQTDPQVNGVTRSEVSGENRLMQQYRERYSRPTRDHQMVLRQQLAGTWKPINRKYLNSVVREYGRPIFGGDPESGSSLGVRYQSKLEDWVIYTYITFGTSTKSLDYNHFIKSPTGEHVDSSVSLLSWLGIAGETHWEDLTDADAKPAVEAVMQFSSHFLTAAESLLTGLQKGISPA